jgi:hypothetical protein
VVTIDDILQSVRSRIRTPEQEVRIRALYERAHAAFEKDRTQGIKQELQSDWALLKSKFDKAIQQVKKETGFF